MLEDVDWRLDHLRRSCTGGAVNKPTLVLSVRATHPEDGSTTDTQFAASAQQLAELHRAVTDALAAADRLVDGSGGAAASRSRRP